MSFGDVRGLLQYVPQFSGKTFVIAIEAPDSALAEALLDLGALQSIGVRLLITSKTHPADKLLDRAVEAELKVETEIQALDSPTIAPALQRGQAVIATASQSDEKPWLEILSQTAVTLQAAKLILLQSANELLPKGAVRASDIANDSNPSALLKSAAQACSSGIPRVHLLDSSQPGVLLDELFSNEGVGTMVYADSYRSIRPLREDDIVELLGMIGRSVRNSHLVPRNYADIADRLSDYSVLDIDGNVVGCVAVYQYDQSDAVELACLYIKQAHEGLGYGLELARHAHTRADQLGAKTIFALTNRAADFFQHHLGYSEIPMEKLPPLRRQQLQASGRNSRAFARELPLSSE